MSFLSSIASMLGASSFGPDEFDALTAQHPAAILLDVRTRNEYVQGHLEGSTLIPLDQLTASLHQIAETQVPIVVICHSGSRASTAASALRRIGKQDVYVLAGGLSYWSSQRRRLESGAKDVPLRDALKKATKQA